MFDAITESMSQFVASNFARPKPRHLPDLPPIKRVSDRVVRILGMNPSEFTLQGTNTYLVGTGPSRWLIDTGEGRREYIPLLRKAMEDEGVTGLEGILLTHYHGDHIGGLQDVRALMKDLGVDEPVLAYKRIRAGNGERAVRTDDNPHGDVDDPERSRCYVDVRDGDLFRCEGATIRALHTPGHTPDHVVFTLQEEGCMFAGDCVLNGNTTTFENLGEYTASLRRMAEALPRGGALYPSHGDVVEDGHKNLEEYMRHRSMREEMFMEALKEDWATRPERGGMTASELCRAVYAHQVSYLVLVTACEGITRQHLAKMTEEGRVIAEGGRGGGGWPGEVRYVPAAGEMAR